MIDINNPIELAIATLEWAARETRTSGSDYGMPHVAQRCQLAADRIRKLAEQQPAAGDEEETRG